MDEYENAVERLYNIKCSKYKTEQLDDELCDILLKEAMKEVIYSSIYNGGRKIRY